MVSTLSSLTRHGTCGRGCRLHCVPSVAQHGLQRALWVSYCAARLPLPRAVAGVLLYLNAAAPFHRSPLGVDAAGVVGLSLSGARIQSATVLLSEDVTDEKAAEAAMQRLKAASIPQHNTVGFMFACVGRGFQHYGAKGNVEADAFRKLFPGIPLFGFFGNGEIGCDRIVTGNFILRKCTEVKGEDLFHSYTTVMALIHLGSPK